MTINAQAAAANPSSEAYRAHARAWLAENLPDSFRMDSVAYQRPGLDELKQWERRLYGAGLAGVTWPTAYGGKGLTIREHLVVNQEIGRVSMPESINSIGKELVGPIVLAIGTEEQKRRYLPAILDIREIWCQGFSEPGAGSDLASLRTRAHRAADGWRISGQKVWTSSATRAQRCLVLARTGKQEDRHRGLMLFAVPMDAPGIRVVPIKQINGLEGFSEVFFEDVTVRDDDALGAPDEGWIAATKVLSIERAINRMYRAWRFEAELRHLLSACEHDPKLRSVLDSGVYRYRLADTAVQIEILKSRVELTVERMLAGEDIGSRGSLTKLHWSEAHQQFVGLAVEILSRASLSPAPEVVRALRRFQEAYVVARSETIYAGTTEIQLGIIADRILDLPKGKRQ